jgi:hypothetical protein
MLSVADRLREEDRRDVRSMTPDARVKLALALGRRDLETFRAARGLDAATAGRLLQRRRQAGRRPSACLADLIG